MEVKLLHQTTREFPRNRSAWGRAGEGKKNRFDANKIFLGLIILLCYPRKHSTRAKAMGLILGSTLRQQRRMCKELFYSKQKTLNQRVGEVHPQSLFPTFINTIKNFFLREILCLVSIKLQLRTQSQRQAGPKSCYYHCTLPSQTYFQGKT